MFHETDKIKNNDLQGLVSKELIAIRIPNFFPAALCDLAAEEITNYGTKDYYEVTKKIGIMRKIGTAIFDYAENPEEVHKYYDNVESTKSLLDSIFDNWNPILKLQKILDKTWKAGCYNESLHDKDMYAGLIRILDKGSYALPHQDMTMWDMPNCEKAQTIKHQFAVNIYIQTPQKGGELVVYDHSIRSRSEYQSRKIDGTYGIDTSFISRKNKITMKPRKGDLIISNSQMLHEVLENTSRLPRITTSCFINYRGKNQPLLMFS